MAKARTSSRCSECGHEEPRWVGRCPACGSWGTMGEERESAGPQGHRPGPARVDARPLGEVPLADAERTTTGIGELDRVLGGGLVPGVVALLGGEPGVGKSTLLLQAAQHVAASGRTVLYLSGEESPGQIRLRADRLGALADRLLVGAETSLSGVLSLVESHEPDVVIVDSIQTISDTSVSSSPGSVAQVRECAAALARCAKATGCAVVVVGHVTKEGTLAGPRVLEHLVDVVLSVEGDRHHALRLVRAVKNRFGAVGEVGCFEMTSHGLAEVTDPSRLFLAEHEGDASGVAVTVTVEGPRPLVVEVQALTAKSSLKLPRRQATGLDNGRLPLLVAVLERRAGVALADQDLFASAVGGVRLREPAADLAVCLAIASARAGRPVPGSLVALGEVGLAGEVRVVPRLSARLAEAARLGYGRALVAAGYDGDDHGLRLHRVRDLSAAIAAALEPSAVSAVA
ncbi:MAG: DNA repair protein RadA [Nitriliruptorales bacterium]